MTIARIHLVISHKSLEFKVGMCYPSSENLFFVANNKHKRKGYCLFFSSVTNRSVEKCKGLKHNARPTVLDLVSRNFADVFRFSSHSNGQRLTSYCSSGTLLENEGSFFRLLMRGYADSSRVIKLEWT